MKPIVRLVLLDDKRTYAYLLHTTPDGRELEVVALGGGPTISEVKKNALRFADALIRAIQEC